MIRRLNYFLFFLILILFSCNKAKDNFEAYLPSPDSRIHIYFNHNKGEPYYLTYYRDEIITYWSLLGFKLSNNISLIDNLEITNTKSRSVKYSESLVDSESLSIKGDFNEMTICFEKKNNPDIAFNLILRVYNEGIAFRYIFTSELNENTVHLVSEETEFNLYASSFNWTIAQDTFNLPVSFFGDDKFLVTITESSESGYPHIKLKSESSDYTKFKCSLYRNPNSNPLKIDAGLKSPWRIILINELKDL